MAIATLTVKLQAQIAEFQREFQEATKSTQKFQQEFEATATKASAMGNIIANGVTQIASSLVSLGQRLIDSASRIDDLSKKIGVSREAIQRWSHAASLSGASIDTVDRAVSFMNKTLAEGDKSTVKALESAGLSFQQIRAMRPEDAFNAIAKAIQGIPDPMQQALVHTKLFGRGAADLLPAIKDGFADVAASARVMSDETIKRLDAAGDAWTRLANTATIHSGELLGSMLGAFDRITSSMKNLEDFSRDTTRFGGLGAAFAAAAVKAGLAADEAERFQRAVAGAPKIGNISFGGTTRPNQFGAGIDVAAYLKREEEASKKAARAAEEYAEVLRRVKAAQIPLTEAQRDSVRHMLALGIAHSDIAKVLRVSEVQVRKYADSQKLAADIEKRLAEESTDAIRNMVTEQSRLLRLRAKDAAASALDYVQSLRIVEEQAKDAIDAMFSSQARAGRAQVQADMEAWLREMQEKADRARGAFVNLSQSLFQLGQVAGGTFGRMVQDLGTVIASIEDARNSFNFMKQGFKDGGFAGFLNGISGALSLVSAAITGVKALLNVLDRNKGRDLVVDFAESMGGFDELQRRLGALGDEGHRLWVMLTQGVGRNNPEQARAAIEAVNEALGRQSSRLANAQSVLAEYGLTWEDAGQKFRNAHLAEQFDALHEKTLTLKEIGVDYNVILEKQAGQYSELVQAALRSGTEIPAAMRPILEDLVRMGKLIDANGNAFTNLEDVTWAKTMTQGFKDVTDAIDRLTLALTRGVGGALDDLSRRRINIPIGYTVEGGIALPRGGTEIPELAHGGIVRRPTLALVGESGPEAVVPLSSVGFGSGGSVVFQRGAFEGIVVDSDERVEQFADRILTAINRGGRLKTKAQRVLG